MKKTRMFLLAAMAIMASSAARAQESCSGECQELGYKPYPYNFIQLQGGVGTTFTDVRFTDLISPTASLGIGRMFFPAVGARLHVNAWESKGGFKTTGDPLTYKFNYVTTDLDLMVNLSNIFSKKHRHLLDVYLIGGVGLNYAWNNDEYNELLATYPSSVVYDTELAWGEGTSRKTLLNHNLRAGLMADLNIAKHWSVGLEIDANSLDDRFNSKHNNSDDWMVTAQLGITYKFGFKKVAKKAEPAPVPVAPKPEPKPVVKPAPVPVPVPKVVDEPLEETIFYDIRQSTPNPDDIIKKVVDWAKKHPDQTITVVGYADKGTGNPTINQKYSQQRAESVAQTLKAQGVPESQLKVEYKGDTVQPFNENDKNRCTIVAGKTK